jgi:Tol biopolymer transport system component/DNA-binding winged helix-turn-helix (wHTH) protein
MLLEKHGFEFDIFFLDTKEKVLYRDGKPLSLTPKAFQLLLFLVENHGHLVGKDEMLRTIWENSFVEEANIAFTIWLLRKTLDDHKQNPRFIETVPKRGYRFIAEVEEITGENELKNNRVRDALPPTANNSPVLKKILIPIFAVFILLIAAVTFSSWYANIQSLEVSAPILTMPFSAEKLSTDGKVAHAVISPDGKNVVYTNGIRSKQSVWLRQIETASSVEIIAPSEDLYGGLALSPDGNSLYFSRRPRNVEGQLDIYRVPIFGGIPNKIVSETQGWISVSPDGSRISFVRCFYREDEFCSLWIADSADGKNEKKLVVRPPPLRIGDNAFSPDGKSVAFAVGQSENAANEFGLSEVNIESGVERELSAEKFFNIKSLVWLPNQSGLFITATKIPNKNFRIWQIAAATGKASPITKDSGTYSALSLDKAAQLLVSTQIETDFRLHLIQMKNPSEGQILANAGAVTFAPNGKIFFSSAMSGNDEIWSVNADGGEQRQLTNNAANDSAPVVSADNHSIFFASNRTGEVHVWRMNADGTDQTQITKSKSGIPIFASPDGRWLYFHSGRDRTLWRVATGGGEEQPVLNKAEYRFAFSPDGSQVAFAEKQNADKVITIVSLADGQIFKTIKLANPKCRTIEIAWLPDGQNLALVLADGEFKNNVLWRQPIDGKPAQRVADLGDKIVFSLAVAPDNNSFAIVEGEWQHDAMLLNGLK